MKIGVIGGTGDMGYGLAMRLAMAGHSVVIGSRDNQRAIDAAQRANEQCGCGTIVGMDNPTAVAASEIVVISVPSAGHKATLETLKEEMCGKVVLDITIPMAFKPLRYAPPEQGSNALETKGILGDTCHVVAGFHTVSASLLEDIAHPLAGSVLLAGDDTDCIDVVAKLAQEIGLTPVSAGGLQFTPTIEGLTPMLIGINRRYGSNHAGVEITGIDK